MLLTGSLIFVVFGIIVAVVLLMIGNLGGVAEVKNEPKPAAESARPAKKADKGRAEKGG